MGCAHLSPGEHFLGPIVWRRKTATKKEQVEALIEWLEKPERENQTVAEVASAIIDSFYELLLRGRKDGPVKLHVGMAFKDAITNKVYHVAWSDGEKYWIVAADSRYGFMGSKDTWEPHAKKSDAKAGAPGNNASGWKVGDKLANDKGRYKFVILQTADKCALLQREDGLVFVEPNDHLEKYYTATERSS